MYFKGITFTSGMMVLSACASASPAQEIRFDSAKEGGASVSDIAQKIGGIDDVFFAANCKDVLTEAVEATANVNHGFYKKPKAYCSAVFQTFDRCRLKVRRFPLISMRVINLLRKSVKLSL